MTSRQKILAIIEKGGEASAKVLTYEIGISKQRIHRILREMVEQNLLYKIGSPPKVLYRIVE